MEVRRSTHIRRRTEEIERSVLVPWASFADASRGRERPEEPCPVRTDYQRDRDRILHTKAFRRLKDKTQVFLAPEGDHYRTRLTHTLEVSQIARTICRGLRLNEDLVEAICLGHDLGHTPFGHIGEEILTECMGRPFEHNRQSLRLVDVLERDGAGLNLTWEVRDGILNHTWRMPEPSTAEAMVARWSDRIAYVNHDVDDAIRAGVLRAADLPGVVTEVLGFSHGRRIDTMVRGIIESSAGAGSITMPAAIAAAMHELREFLFEKVYLGPARVQEERAAHVLRALFSHLVEHPEDIPSPVPPDGDDPVQRVADHLAGMTDRYAVAAFERLFVPGAQL